jgi:hypothetical protein
MGYLCIRRLDSDTSRPMRAPRPKPIKTPSTPNCAPTMPPTKAPLSKSIFNSPGVPELGEDIALYLNVKNLSMLFYHME